MGPYWHLVGRFLKEIGSKTNLMKNAEGPFSAFRSQIERAVTKVVTLGCVGCVLCRHSNGGAGCSISASKNEKSKNRYNPRL